MNKIICNIKALTEEIIDEINKLDLNNKEYLLEYKLNDLINLDIKRCKTCGSYFIHRSTNKIQKFCNDDCRYNSTKAVRREKVVNDLRFRRIDNLRKAIYERKYRAKIIQKPLNNLNELNSILEELKVLQKERLNMDLNEFNKAINTLRKRYKQAF